MVGVGVSLGLGCTCCHNVLVFGHVLPPTHASLVPSLTPTPTIPHLQGPLKPFFLWFSFNLHPPSVTSIRTTSSHLVNDSPILAIFCPLSHNQVKTQERNMPLGALTEYAPPPHSHLLVLESSSCPHAATLQAEGETCSLLYWTQAPCPNFRANLPSTLSLTTPPYPPPTHHL